MYHNVQFKKSWRDIYFCIVVYKCVYYVNNKPLNRIYIFVLNLVVLEFKKKEKEKGGIQCMRVNKILIRFPD